MMQVFHLACPLTLKVMEGSMSAYPGVAPQHWHPQNAQIAKLLRSTYSSGELEATRSALVSHGTIKLRRYHSGGHSAVTVLDLDKTLESAVDGLLIFHWDRDNIMQALAEFVLSADNALNAGLGIDSEAWVRGLFSSITHHRRYEGRFLDVIHDKVSSADFGCRPNIRYNPIGLHELREPWGHAQNDALSYVNFLLFHAINKGKLNWNDPRMVEGAAFATLLHCYFWKINVWADLELGAWEDKCAEHWSSIACALVSFREQLKAQHAHGELKHERADRPYWCREQGIVGLIEKCEAKLQELGTREFIRSDDGSQRDTDLAQLNPLLLAAFSGEPVLSDENTVAVLENIERELVGSLGIRRYRNDVWDGRINRTDLGVDDETQWCHGSAQMSYIWGELYQRIGADRYFEKQLTHFNRGLAAISPRWSIPEAWICDPITRSWIADGNEPLAWAQAMLILSLSQMKASVLLRERSKPI